MTSPDKGTIHIEKQLSLLAGFDGASATYVSVNSDQLLGTANYIWDTGTLAWIKDTGAGGGGGGGSVTWTVTEKQKRKQLKAAIERVIQGIKEESSKVV